MDKMERKSNKVKVMVFIVVLEEEWGRTERGKLSYIGKVGFLELVRPSRVESPPLINDLHMVDSYIRISLLQHDEHDSIYPNSRKVKYQCITLY